MDFMDYQLHEPIYGPPPITAGKDLFRHQNLIIIPMPVLQELREALIYLTHFRLNKSALPEELSNNKMIPILLLLLTHVIVYAIRK
jgi:hypothetical protein